MRAIKIDSAKKSIEEININSIEDIRKIVDGSLEATFIDRQIALFTTKRNKRGKFHFLGDETRYTGTAVVVGVNRNKIINLKERKESFEMMIEWD